MLHEITHNLGGVQQSAPHHHLRLALHATARTSCATPTAAPEAAGYNHVRLPAVPPARSRRPTTAATTTTSTPTPPPGSYLARIGTSTPAPSWARAPSSGWRAATTSSPRSRSTPRCRRSPAPRSPARCSPRAPGTWLNSPTTYALQWQRAAGGDWANIPGAIGANYVATAADAGVALRVVVTATNADGSAIVASAPTAPVVAPRAGPVATPKPAAPTEAAHRAARPRAPRQGHAGGDASSPSRPGARCARRRPRSPSRPGPGACACAPAPRTARLRCALTKRVRTRTHTVRLPAARVLVRSAKGALRVTAALVDRRQRIRAQGSAAGA